MLLLFQTFDVVSDRVKIHVLQLLSGAVSLDTEIHNDLIPAVQRQIFVLISVASTHSFELATSAFIFINALVSDIDEDIIGGVALREELLQKGLARIIMVRKTYFSLSVYLHVISRNCEGRTYRPPSRLNWIFLKKI